MLKQLLFPAKPDGTATSAMLLIARIVFGILFLSSTYKCNFLGADNKQ